MKSNKIKKRLIILSDLWGKEKSDWLQHYTDLLSSDLDIKYYDCCELGNVSKSDYSQESLHKQFVNDGIKAAVTNLIKKEQKRVSILAFSVGGVIAWKAGLDGLNIDQLIAVSSTRLRYEQEKPNCSIKLYFGGMDVFRPDDQWFQKMGLDFEIMSNEGHDLYKKAVFAEEVIEGIVYP